MLKYALTPSRNEDASKREVNLILADGQIITVYCIESSKTRVQIGIEAPDTVEIHVGKLDSLP